MKCIYIVTLEEKLAVEFGYSRAFHPTLSTVGMLTVKQSPVGFECSRTFHPQQEWLQYSIWIWLLLVFTSFYILGLSFVYWPQDYDTCCNFQRLYLQQGYDTCGLFHLVYWQQDLGFPDLFIGSRIMIPVGFSDLVIHSRDLFSNMRSMLRY